MKKKIIIIISLIVLIMIAVGTFWWIDNLKVIESPSNILKDGQKGYKLEQTDNTIILTVYTYLTPRIITTFYFENNVYKNATFTKVYKSKLEARKGLAEEYSSFYNRKLDKNVVSGDISLTVNEDIDTYFKTLDDTYSKSCIKLD